MKNIILYVLLITFSQFTFSQEENRLTLPEGYGGWSRINEETFKESVKLYFSNVTDVDNIVFEEEFYPIDLAFCVITLGLCGFILPANSFSVAFTVKTTQGHRKDIKCAAYITRSRQSIFSGQAKLIMYNCESEEISLRIEEMVVTLEQYQL